MKSMTRLAGFAVMMAAIPAMAGCGSSSTGATSASVTAVPTASAPASAGSLVVMAAGPLKSALDQAKAAFEAANPGVTVTLDYGHVPSLLTQLSEGVLADVLVTPDAGTMKMAQDKGFVVATPTPVAGNPLALVVPQGNPGKVEGVQSLTDDALAIAVCAKELPCGKLTDQLAGNAAITIAADSLEPGGSPAVVTKAASGEIEVGVVFASDIKAGGDKVQGVPIDPAVLVTAQVMAAPLSEAADPGVAQSFVDFLASPEGMALFTSAGFTSL